MDGNGNVYVADQLNNVIRKILPDGKGYWFYIKYNVLFIGTVSTFAGSIGGKINGNFTTAKFSAPSAIVWHPTKNVFYVADYANHLIKVIDPNVPGGKFK